MNMWPKTSLTLLLPSLFLLSLKAWSYENELSLKFGPSTSMTVVKTYQQICSPSIGMGFHSHISYKWTKWEASLSSYALMAPINRARILVSGSDVSGSFNFRSLTFGPIMRYHLPYRPLAPNWPLYALAGYMAAQQSFKSRQVHSTGGEYEPYQKVTLESFGPIIGIGLEEEVTPKKYNFFYELVFRSLHGRRLDRVGGTHTQVKELSTEKSPVRYHENTIQFNIGIILF